MPHALPAPLHALAERVAHAAAQTPLRMALASGLLLAAAFPPLPLAPLALLGFVPLLAVIDARIAHHRSTGRPRRTFAYAYAALLLWNLLTCYWLMFTAFGAASTPELLTNLGSGLMANLVNPLVMSIPLMLYARLRRTAPGIWGGHWTFVPIWLAFEWLHFNWDLSWSWITLGHSHTMFPLLIQHAELTGVLGISLALLVGNALIYAALQRRHMRPLWALGGLLGGLLGINALLMHPGRDVFRPAGHANVRVVQPNINPFAEKFARAAFTAQVSRFASLAAAPGIDTIDLVVLPETAIPRGIFAECIDSFAALAPLRRVVDTHQVALLTGFIELRFYPHTPPPAARPYGPDYDRHFHACTPHPEGWYETFNASALLQPAAPAQTAQKAKLVPFVERAPFLAQLQALKEYNIDLGGDFGNYGLPDSLRVLHAPPGASGTPLRLAPLVCYESEYGSLVAALARRGANLLAIITNDGWWKQSSGHVQHAHFASLRAIETRRDIARSANTGISLFADAWGTLHQRTPWWTVAYADRKLALRTAQTFYVRTGDWLGPLAGICVLGILGGAMLGAYWGGRLRSKR